MNKVTFDKTTESVINPAIQEFSDWYSTEFPAEHDACTRMDVFAFKHRQQFLRCWLTSRSINIQQLPEEVFDFHYLAGV